MHESEAMIVSRPGNDQTPGSEAGGLVRTRVFALRFTALL